MNHKLDTDEKVFFYEQEFYVLSNFSSFKLLWRGELFDTSEAAYHSEKFISNPSMRERIRTAHSAHDAFSYAQKYKSFRRADWDNVKEPAMLAILLTKVEQHEYVRRKLLQTGKRCLVEDSWRDDYWGSGPDGNGQNVLGSLWEIVRDYLAYGIRPTDLGYTTTEYQFEINQQLELLKYR